MENKKEDRLKYRIPLQRYFVQRDIINADIINVLEVTMEEKDELKSRIFLQNKEEDELRSRISLQYKRYSFILHAADINGLEVTTENKEEEKDDEKKDEKKEEEKEDEKEDEKKDEKKENEKEDKLNSRISLQNKEKEDKLKSRITLQNKEKVDELRSRISLQYKRFFIQYAADIMDGLEVTMENKEEKKKKEDELKSRISLQHERYSFIQHAADINALQEIEIYPPFNKSENSREYWRLAKQIQLLEAHWYNFQLEDYSIQQDMCDLQTGAYPNRFYEKCEQYYIYNGDMLYKMKLFRALKGIPRGCHISDPII